MLRYGTLILSLIVAGFTEEVSAQAYVGASSMRLATSYGCVGDGTTNNDACITAALAALDAAGGGTLYFPPGTYRINSQILIPNNSGSPQPDQDNFRFLGDGGGAHWYGSSATVLDLRYTAGDGNAKIETRGRGTLAIDGLTIKDGGASNATPFIHSTNTVLVIERNTFIGTGNTTQDAIVLGGIDTNVGSDVDSPFQGYGTRIAGNHFRAMNRGIYGLNYANAVVFAYNSFQGNTGTVAIEFDGSNGGGQFDYGNQIIGNVIEMDVYTYGIKFTRARENELIGNQMHDPHAAVGSYYRLLDLSTQNRIICGTSASSETFLSGEAASLAATTILCAQSGMLDPSGKGPASSQFAYGAVVTGSYDSSKNYPGPLTISDKDTPAERISIGYDHAGSVGVIDAHNGASVRPLVLAVASVTAPRFDTTTNCADAAGAAACGAASAGHVVIDAAATTVVVSTTTVTANSQVFLTEDPSAATRLGITCNTTTGRLYTVTARTAGTSFTITTSVAPVTNPACLSYRIVN